ncbi:MAG: multiheme c-type cytochrome, partial [Planctomycetota bacterium]
CDLLFVLAHAPERELIELAEAYPELDAVFATGPSQPIPPRRVAGRTLLVSVGSKGKFIASVSWDPVAEAPGTWEAGAGTIVELTNAYKDDPKIMEVVREYQEALRRADLPPARTGEAHTFLARLPDGYRFAGSRSCNECHEKDNKTWASHRHSKGMETLAKKGFEADPHCLRCHTTGYGGPGGFRSLRRTPDRAGIGCENCHGPSVAHNEAAQTRRTPIKAKEACVGCHNKDKSPDFEYDEYWKKITHGEKQPQQKVAGGGAEGR